MDNTKWPVLACQWQPGMVIDPDATTQPKRKQNYLLLRWGDTINDFCKFTLATVWQNAPVNDWLDN